MKKKTINDCVGRFAIMFSYVLFFIKITVVKNQNKTKILYVFFVITLYIEFNAPHHMLFPKPLTFKMYKSTYVKPAIMDFQKFKKKVSGLKESSLLYSKLKFK